MNAPARPMRGAADAKVVRDTLGSRSSSTAGASRATPAIDVAPNWRHVGTLVDNIIAGISVVST